MITYKQPNYRLAQERAYNTILNSQLRTLPINLRTIINQFDNLHLQKYSVFAWSNGLTIDEACNLVDSKEGCLWMRNDNQYIILYNDTIESKERIRFTIAHEIGHYVLGHHELSNKTKISRYTLSMEEDEAFEKEANYFAKRLLVPLPIVYDFVSIWSRISRDLIMDIFDVSYTVSGHIIEDLNRAYRYGITGISHDMNIQFEKYIEKVKYSLWCNNCRFTFSSNTASYCPICGQDNLINDSMHVIRRSNNMIYPGYDLDNDMRVIKCPNCENEEIEGNYCKVCATYLFNICTGFDKNDGTDDPFRPTIRWGNNQHGCDLLLEGNARFCHECGSTSSFFEDGLLTDWDEEGNNEKELVTSGAPIDIDDSDLPF